MGEEVLRLDLAALTRTPPSAVLRRYTVSWNRAPRAQATSTTATRRPAELAEPAALPGLVTAACPA